MEVNEEYISAALKQMCYTTSDAGLFCPIAQEAGTYIYDMATLNEAVLFLTDGLSLEEGVSAVVIEAYYGENISALLIPDEDGEYIFSYIE